VPQCRVEAVARILVGYAFNWQQFDAGMGKGSLWQEHALL